MGVARTDGLGAVLLLVWTLLGCEAPRFYPGPERPSSEIASVELVGRRSRITRIDGKEVTARQGTFLPGGHTLEFSWHSTELIAGLVPRMSTRCAIRVVLEAGHVYRFDPQLEATMLDRLPSHDRRWTRYRVDPVLRDETTGFTRSGMKCVPKCRVHGHKDGEETRSCTDVEGAGIDPTTPLRKPSSTDEPRDPEADELARAALEKIVEACESRHRSERDFCIWGASSYFAFQAEDGSILVFAPATGTRMTPGVRNEIGEVCTRDLSAGELARCFAGYGWELLR